MFKKAFILSFGNIVNTIIAGLFGIYVTRVLGPENKGILTIAISSCDLMAMLFSFGIPYSAAYYVRSHPGNETMVKTLTNRAMVICGALSLVLILIGKDAFSTFFLGGWDIDPFMTALLVLTIIVNSGNTVIGAAVIAQGDSNGFVISTNVGTVVTVLCTLVLITTMPLKLHSVVLGSLLGNLVATILLRRHYRTSMARGNGSPAMTARQFYTYGFQAQAGAIATLVFKRMDLYIISHFLNTSAVGFYSIGLSLRDLAMAASRAVAGLSGGDLADPSKQADGSAKTIFRKGVAFNANSSLVIFLASLVLFPSVIPFAYGPAFSRSVAPAMIIMFSLVPLSVALLVGKAVQAKGKPLNLSVSNVVSAVISSFVVWVLTKEYGIEGAAISTIIGCMVLLGASWISLRIADGGFPRSGMENSEEVSDTGNKIASTDRQGRASGESE